MDLATWLPVIGYEGAYEISSDGRVRSLTRHVYAGSGRMRSHVGRELAIYTGDHYSKVRLKLDGDGGSTKNVHQLLAQAFLGPCPAGMEVCHSNGQHHDNRVENLRYDTHISNLQDIPSDKRGRPEQTSCARGHAFTPGNTRIQKRTGGGILRTCRTCALAREKKYREAALWTS